MDIDPKDLPSVHIFLKIVERFLDEVQVDQKWEEHLNDARLAMECVNVMLTKPIPGTDPCKGLIRQIIADKYPFIKE